MDPDNLAQEFELAVETTTGNAARDRLRRRYGVGAPAAPAGQGRGARGSPAPQGPATPTPPGGAPAQPAANPAGMLPNTAGANPAGSAAPQHQRRAGLLPDVAPQPPVRGFLPAGLAGAGALNPWAQSSPGQQLTDEVHRAVGELPGEAKAVIGDILRGVGESPSQVTGGVFDAVNNTLQAIEDLDNSIEEKLGLPNLDPTEGMRLPEVGEAESVTGGLLRSTSQFLAGFVPAMKAVRGISLGSRWLQAMEAGAAADLVVWDPHEQRLSTWLNQVPALAPLVPDYLADNNPEHESDWEGRLKNAAEGAGIGLMADSLFRLFRYYKSARTTNAQAQAQAASGADLAQMQARDAIRDQATADLVQPLPPGALDNLGDPQGPTFIGAPRGETFSEAIRMEREARDLRLIQDVMPAGMQARFTREGVSVIGPDRRRLAMIERPQQVDESFLAAIGQRVEQSGIIEDTLGRVKGMIADAENVARIQQSAQAMKTMVGEAAAPVVDFMDEMLNTARSGAGRDPGLEVGKYPTLRLLREQGGVKPGSPLAQELIARGVTARRMPGLFNRRGVGAADNIPASENPQYAADGQGYIDEEDLLSAIDEELAGNPRLDPIRQQARFDWEDAERNALAFRTDLEGLGVNFDTMDNASIRQRLADVEAERARLADMEEVPPPTSEAEFQGLDPDENITPSVATGSLPPVPAGHVRLFRAEPARAAELPEWIAQAKAADGSLAAQGRWFTTDAQALDWYRNDQGGPRNSRTVYVDVPAESVEQFRVSNQPNAATFSRDPSNEFFLSPEMAAQARGAPGPRVYINHARINTTDDVHQLIRDMAESDADAINVKRRGTVTNRQTIDEARQEFTRLEDLIGRAPGPMSAAQAVAARKILTASGEQLLRLAQVAQSATAGAADLFNFRRAVQVHYAVQSEVFAARTETARALQSWVIPAGNDKMRADAIAELLNNAGGAGDIQRMAASLSTLANNPVAVQQFVKMTAMGRLRDVMFEVWINGLLSSPKTHMVNTLSNSLTALWQIPERYLAAGISHAFYNGDVKAGEVAAQMYGIVQGARDGARLVLHGVADPRVADLYDNFRKTELPQGEAITAVTLGANPDGAVGMGVNLIGRVIRVPGTALDISDRFFKAVNYRMELNALALRQASSEGLEGPDLSARVADILANPPDTLRLEAIDTAKINTFTKELGRVGKLWQQAINATPMMRVVVPFIRTPANILKFTFRRTPLAFASAQVRADIRAGGARAAQAYARIGAGSLLMLTIADLAGEGSVTGAGPSDPILQQRQRETGWRPYSVRWRDRYYAYNRLDPLGMLMGMGADIAEIMGSLDEQESDKLAAAAVTAFAQNLASKTWASGAFALVGALDPRNPVGGFDTYFENLAGGAIPFSGMLRHIASTMDPMLRDTRANAEAGLDFEGLQALPAPVAETLQEILNRYRRGIPGLGEGLPGRLTLWGEPITTETGFGWAYDFLSPVGGSAAKNDPVSQMVIDNRIKLSLPERTIRGVRLTSQEYWEYVRLAGAPAKEQIARMMQMPIWKRLSTGPDGAQADAVRNVVSRFREQAAGQMLLLSPRLRTRHMEGARDRLQLRQIGASQ